MLIITLGLSFACSNQSFTGIQKLKSNQNDDAQIETNTAVFEDGETEGASTVNDPSMPDAAAAQIDNEQNQSSNDTLDNISDGNEEDDSEEDIIAIVPAAISGAHLVSCGPIQSREEVLAHTDAIAEEVGERAFGCHVENKDDNSIPVNINDVYLHVELASGTLKQKSKYPINDSGDDIYFFDFVFFATAEEVNTDSLLMNIKNQGGEGEFYGAKLASISEKEAPLDDLTEEMVEKKEANRNTPLLASPTSVLVDGAFQVYIVGNVEADKIYTNYNDNEINFVMGLIEEFSQDSSLPINIWHIDRGDVNFNSIQDAALIVMNDLGLPYGAYQPGDQDLIEGVFEVNASGVPVLNIGDDFALTSTLGGDESLKVTPNKCPTH
ncbi:MAG: hypothetical protein HRU09_20880 [Oligoflexales bacterium]|nr:hypothetical protein [Oligoflexales bacterium]